MKKLLTVVVLVWSGWWIRGVCYEIRDVGKVGRPANDGFPSSPERPWAERYVEWLRNCSPSRANLIKEHNNDVAGSPQEEMARVYAVPFVQEQGQKERSDLPGGSTVRRPVYW